VIARHELLANTGAFAIDLIVRRAKAPQHGFGHGQRHFALTRKHAHRARPSE
jgi:hypothetical protein